jgi:peptidoglycan/LPS O-acetylase OafA/YrhL
LLDFITHRPDMPLYPGGSERLGLALWNSLPATFALEGVMFALAIALYVRFTRAKDRVGTIAWWALTSLLLALYIPGPWSPPPPSENAVAIAGVAALLIFVPLACWVDRHRDVSR